jgi:hypothetical protein
VTIRAVLASIALVLAWTWGQNNAVGHIWRKTGEKGTWIHIADVAGTSKPTYTDNSALTKGITYFYTVCAGPSGTLCSNGAWSVVQ